MNRAEILKTYAVPLLFPVLALADSVVIKFARFFPKKFDKDVIFIRTDNFGDFILWLPAAAALRRNWPWPGHRFVLIANDSWGKIAETLEICDEVILINRAKFQRRVGYRFNSLLSLARRTAELVVNPIHSRDPLSADSIARAIAAKRKIAAKGDTSNALGQESLVASWYDQLIVSADVAMHESLRNRAFLLSFCGLELQDPWPKLQDLRLCGSGLDFAGNKRPYVVVAPGAGAQRRAWPADRFAALINRMAREFSIQVVLGGSIAELSLLAEIERLCGTAVVNLGGKLAFSEFLPVLAQAALIITNETGIAHAGAAARVPTVCIVGGGHFGRFVPYPDEAKNAGIQVFSVDHQMACYGCNWRCIYRLQSDQVVPCISNIEVEQVWTAVTTALREGKSAQLPLRNKADGFS